jgi:hypothetical protein
MPKRENMTARILQIVVGIAGLCALVLGLFIWIANSDLTDIHMLFRTIARRRLRIPTQEDQTTGSCNSILDSRGGKRCVFLARVIW